MTASSESPTSNQAAHLVKAMQIDRLVLYGLQQALLQGQKRNEGRTLSDEEKRFYECVYAADSAAYVPALSGELANQLSSDEILQAIRFFEGPVGKKLVEHDLVSLTNLFSGRAGSFEGLSEAQLNELEQFKKTPVGKKILVQGILNSRSIVRTLAEKSEELTQECAKKA